MILITAQWFVLSWTLFGVVALAIRDASPRPAKPASDQATNLTSSFIILVLHLAVLAAAGAFTTIIGWPE